MPESSLSISYGGLLAEVGRFLGYGNDRTAWTDGQLEEIDGYVTAGIRQFYYPPAAESIEAGYEWSFLKPTAELDIEADTAVYPLPSDLGRIVGNLHFAASAHAPSVVLVSESRIQSYASLNESSGIPRYAAVRVAAPVVPEEPEEGEEEEPEEGEEEEATDPVGQRIEIVFWPTPNAAFTLAYRYEAFSGKLTDENPYPLGGMRHSELITESCLAVAEQRANDERGLHTEQFVRLLATSVAQDKRNGARFFGHMGGEEIDSHARVRPIGNLASVSYKGETW